MVSEPTISHQLIHNNQTSPQFVGQSTGQSTNQSTDQNTDQNTGQMNGAQSHVRYDLHPYGLAAQIYRDAGWLAPLPVDFPNGGPVPRGYTGGKNADAFPPTDEKVAEWQKGLGHMNLGLWLPRDIIGIDVDAYDDRGGDATLNWLVHERVKKPFPKTWTSTCRGPMQDSRIHFFRIPSTHNDWVSRKNGIDIVRFGHRFARVWPSVKHDKEIAVHGLVYRWYDPSGNIVEPGVVPVKDVDIPFLDSDWIDAFRKRRMRTRSSSGGNKDTRYQTARGLGYGQEMTSDEINEWTARLHAYDVSDDRITDGMCDVMRTVLQRYVNELHGTSGRHDAAKDGVWSLLSEAVTGHVGGRVAVDVLGDEFIRVVTGDNTRTLLTAEGEWARLVIGAVERIAADVPLPDTIERCSCDKHNEYLMKLGFKV